MDFYAYLLICMFIGLFVAMLICEIFDKIKEAKQDRKTRLYTDRYIMTLERENRSMKRTLDFIRFERMKAEIENLGEPENDGKATKRSPA